MKPVYRWYIEVDGMNVNAFNHEPTEDELSLFNKYGKFDVVKTDITKLDVHIEPIQVFSGNRAQRCKRAHEARAR